MRYKSDHKEQTKPKNIKSASCELRLHGFDEISSSTLMTKPKLAHPGFYPLFEDRKDLMARALASSSDGFASHRADVQEADRVFGRIKPYLSEDHPSDPHIGCPLSALAPDVSRHPDLLKSQFGAKLERTVNLIPAADHGKNSDVRHARAWFLLGSPAGAILVAGAVSDPARRALILDLSELQLITGVHEDGIQLAAI